MDFTNRPFRDEWLNPGKSKPEQTMPADGGTLPEEGTGLAPSAALEPSHEITSPEEPAGAPPRAALAAARGVAPESLTLTQWLSKELVLPEQLVRHTPAQALEELRARQLESNPHLAAWAGKSVQNAAHARENVEYLNRFRDAFDDEEVEYLDLKPSFAEFMDSLGKPGEMLMHGASEVAQNVGRVLTHGMADVNAAFAGSALAVAENVFGRDSVPARWARSARDWANWARPKEVKAETALGQFGYDALRIAPQMAATVAAAAAGPAAAAGIMGSQIFGSSYNELRGKGVSPLSAALNAGANTALQLPMERFGLEKLLRAIRTTGTKEALKNWLGAALSEGLTEGAQKAPEFVTHLWAEAERHGSTTGERVDWFAKQVTDADNLMQATREAIYEGLLGGVWGGAFGGVGAVRSFRQERERGKKPDALAGLLAMPEIREALTAEAEQAGLMAQRQALGNALTQAASELEGAPAAGDPAAMREMTEAVLPEQFRQAWIGPDDAVRLFQEAQARDEGEAAALLETLGTDEAGLAQAHEQGEPLPVSTAAVLAQLKGEGRANVMDALRVTPDGLSGTEAAAYDPAARAEKLVRNVLDLEEESEEGSRDVADALRAARSAQKVRADVRREVTRIRQEIEAAGYTPHAAHSFALLMEQEAMTAHAVYGVDPVAFILQRISVARGEQALEGSLGQAAMYAATDADLSSFISRVREEARGEKPSYFVLTGEGIPVDAEVRVTSDLIRHQARRHPDMTLEDNEKLPTIVAGINGENTRQVGTGTYGTRFKGMQEVDGTAYAYVFDIGPNATVSLVTFFKDSPEGIRDWYLRPEKKKKKASKVPVERAEARTNDSSLPLGKPSAKRLSDFIAKVKDGLPWQQEQQLFQTAPTVGSPAFKNWFGKSKVVDEKGQPLTVYHGTGATVGEDFGFDYRFSGKNGSADGYGFYFTSDENTAKDYQEKGGSLVKAYLSLQKPMPVKQKPFSKAVLKKILKKAVEKEIEQFPDETPDYRDSFLSNYADTYEMSFDRALNEAVEMIYEAETALEQIAEIANASGNKRATAEAVRAVTGYDGVFANGYGDKGAEGGKIYVAWFPEQVKSVENRGTWDAADPRIFFQSAYHGSPYRFDKFTLDHIGSGEGVQAHGWGLYFAQDKNVSEGYRARLKSVKIFLDDKLFYDTKKGRTGYSTGSELVDARLILARGDIDEALTKIQANDIAEKPVIVKAIEILQGIKAENRLKVEKGDGQLYEVDIPENDELLDEQKTLAEQPEAVREALERGSDLMPDDEPQSSMVEYLYQALEDGANVTGRDLYKALSVLGTENYEERLEVTSSGARAASEFLNSLGIKGITYVGHEDGRCFVVFDDKAISILNTFYQKRKPVEVNSAALGVPEGASIREYRDAAKKFHDQLLHESQNGKPVLQPQLDKPVRFSHKGWGKNAYGGANKQKWQMFPFLREIIETSRLIVSNDIKPSTKGFVKAHWLENDVILDGKPFQVGFTLLEDAKGNLFYNFNADLEEWRKKNSGPSKLPGNSNPGESGPLHQDASTSDELIIPTDTDGVNLHIFESRATGRAQGAIRPMEDGRYVVGLFKSKNASTVLHETAHFWLEELRRAAGLETAPEWVREAWAKLEKAYGFEGASLTPETWREVQERFAREFEAYAREGKAPSWELQTAFSRFRNWLTDIYRSIKAILGVHEVSPEVREIFDALLATDEEIEQSRRAVERGAVMDRLGGEVAPELRDKYARAVQKAHENASSVIANRCLVDRRKAERDFREKATATIDGSETYKLIARLREEGIPFDAFKGAISEDLAYRLREKWRRTRGEGRALIRKGGTLDILDVAAQFNEDTAQGLASVLLDTPTRREAIDAQVAAELAEWDAAYDAEVEYSSAYDEVLALEMEALTGEKQLSPAALRRQMDERTDARKMSQVDAEYQALKARLRSGERSTRRAAREARQESNAEWRERMAELKEKERLRRAALGAAYRARLERDAIVRQLRKVGDSKTIPYDHMCQIRRLLGRFDGLGTPGQRLDPETLRGLPTLQEFVAGITGPFGESVTAPEWLLGDKAGRFSDLSLEEMREVKRLIMEIAHAGRTEGTMLADAEKRAIREVAEGCAEQMGTLSQRTFISERAGLLDTVRGALRKGLSSITSMRFLARWMDGFAQGGVNQKAWFMPLQQALSDELTLKREMEQLLRAAVTPLLKVGRLTEAFAIDGVPLQEDVQRLWKGLFDMDKVYSVALNMGNAGNLKALMAGYGWSEADLARITAHLTAEEWQAIQAVWDAINTLYPRLDATYRALKGVPLPKVKAQAFTVVTADGQRLRLKGGYYPLIFDQRLSGKAAENQSVDEMLNGTEAVLRTPNPKSGMTNARKGGTLPPLLSMTVIDRHVADTIHYITHALPLRDAMRLFREPAFKAAFINAAGQENYDQLLPWLRGIARPDGEQMHGIMKAMDWMAKRGTMFAMGLNMKSALLQLTSIGNSWSEVGTGNFMRAAATLLSGPRESWETIRRKSAYMQSRAQFMDESLRREYAEMRANGVGGVRFRNARYALALVQKAQFALISALDTAVAAPTWLAAYDKAIARGAEESAAVDEADAAVVAAQGGGGALDTPAVMRQAGLMRILCPFMSFALSDFNRKLETVRGLREYQKTGNSAISYGRAFSDFALQWVMPVVLSCLMVGLGRDDEWPDAEDYGWEALTFFTMGIPLARDVARMAQDQFSGSGFKGGRTPLAFTGVDNLLRGAKHARQAIVDDKADAGYLALKESLNAVGFFLGIGTPQIWRTVEGSEAYFVDDEGGVLAPLLGKPGKK